MPQKYLLYIDILGFTEMVAEPERVRSLYSIIDSLNVHQHGGFRTIVFSDTILTYNTRQPDNDYERKYLVSYAIEFAEDLHHRLIGTDTYFRAVLTHGDFDHYNLANAECFFGQALVDAYRSEKSLPAIGLFIDDVCLAHNEYFRTARFSSNRSFVYLTTSLERLHQISSARLPIDPFHFHESMELVHILWDLRFLRDISVQMQQHPEPAVRAKYLATWDLYHRQYTALVDVLRANSFDPEPICPTANWHSYQQVFSQSLAESPLAREG